MPRFLFLFFSFFFLFLILAHSFATQVQTNNIVALFSHAMASLMFIRASSRLVHPCKRLEFIFPALTLVESNHSFKGLNLAQPQMGHLFVLLELPLQHNTATESCF